MEGAGGGGVRREAKIRWELLGREEVAEEYRRRVDEVVKGVEEQERKELGEWEKISNSVKAAAREVCGVVMGKIVQPWMVGREEEVSRFSGRGGTGGC